MHAPPLLLIVASVLGIVVPVAINLLTLSMDNNAATVVVRALSLAVVPVLIARIAYRQGFERASSGRQSPVA
jgi:hypothetical protein